MCQRNALDGMLNVVSRTCAHPNCSRQPCHGMADTRNKAEMCAVHSLDGMVNVKNLLCNRPNYSKRPSRGMVGSKKAEMCSEHALKGMVNVVSRTCAHPNCSTARVWPSYGMAGSKKAETCAEHALDGMMSLTRRLPCPRSSGEHESGGGSGGRNGCGDHERTRRSPAAGAGACAGSR